MCYGVNVTAVVSNWFVTCGSFFLKDPNRDISLPVFKGFVSASPFAEDFELRVASVYHQASAGEDLENQLLDTMLATIQEYAGRNEHMIQVARLPTSTAPSYRVPVSYHFPIEFSRMIVHYGYGERADARVLVHTIAGERQATQITALFFMESLRHMLMDHTSQTPPPQLQALVAWMLSYWTFLDRQDRAQYTEFPLARVVVLCPVDHGTWLWH